MTTAEEKLEQQRAHKRDYTRKWRAAHPEKQREYHKRWRAKHPNYERNYRATHVEQTRAASKAWRERHADQWRACHAANYRRKNAQESLRIRALKYGLKPEQFIGMLEAQDYKCAGCGGEFTREIKLHDPMTPRVDHDHATGAIRGLLCNGCNLALGNTGDSPERLRNLADYLERALSGEAVA